MFISLVIGFIGVFLLGSCSSTGAMVGGSGYYDNMYYHGYPSYYGAYGVNPYLYPRNRIIHNNIIVVPEKKGVENRDNVRRRESVSPNSRRKVTPSKSVRSRSETNSTINRRQNAPSRENSVVAPSSRRTVAPNRDSSRGRGN